MNNLTTTTTVSKYKYADFNLILFLILSCLVIFITIFCILRKKITCHSKCCNKYKFKELEEFITDDSPRYYEASYIKGLTADV